MAAARPKTDDEPVNVPTTDWVALEVLRREAEALIGNAGAEDDTKPTGGWSRQR